MLVWIKGAPKYSPEPDNENEVCLFIDIIISCKVYSPDKNLLMRELVNSRQTHRHTHTCYKKSNRRKDEKICRFGIPFFPVDKTRIIHPFSDEGDGLTKAELESRKEYKQLGKTIRLYLEENSEELQNSNMSFEDFLNIFKCNTSDYFKTVQSTMKCSKFLLKRSVREVYINNYNPLILSMHRANMDIQYVVDPYACCVYVVDYIKKSDKGITKVLQNILEESIKDDAPTQTVLKNLSSKYYNTNEV